MNGRTGLRLKRETIHRVPHPSTLCRRAAVDVSIDGRLIHVSYHGGAHACFVWHSADATSDSAMIGSRPRLSYGSRSESRDTSVTALSS